MEQFSKSMIQLSKKTKIDLAKHLGQGTVRDFRILNLKEVLENQGIDETVSTTQSSVANVTDGGDDEEMEVDEGSDEEIPSKRAKM